MAPASRNMHMTGKPKIVRRTPVFAGRTASAFINPDSELVATGISLLFSLIRLDFQLSGSECANRHAFEQQGHSVWASDLFAPLAGHIVIRNHRMPTVAGQQNVSILDHLLC